MFSYYFVTKLDIFRSVKVESILDQEFSKRRYDIPFILFFNVLIFTTHCRLNSIYFILS